MIETREIRTCDMEHAKPRTNADTVPFSLDGTNYEVELCPKDREAIEKIFGKYTPHARRAKVTSVPAVKVRTVIDRRNSARIRAWAASQGIQVSERGRIPESVIQKYAAAH
jgi:nucleoid-associated protein Lsr2